MQGAALTEKQPGLKPVPIWMFVSQVLAELTVPQLWPKKKIMNHLKVRVIERRAKNDLALIM